MKDFHALGVIGRFKPLHNGGVIMLESVCDIADHAKIGIGSCNKYNPRNPFTAEESSDMIDAALAPRFSNYEILYIPDFGHMPQYRDGKRWAEEVVKLYGELDAFVSSNEYVMQLLGNHYRIIHPSGLIPEEKHVMVRGTIVRVEMAKGEGWRKLVSREVEGYLDENRLVERFRREFGLETLAALADGSDYAAFPKLEKEMSNAREV